MKDLEESLEYFFPRTPADLDEVKKNTNKNDPKQLAAKGIERHVGWGINYDEYDDYAEVFAQVDKDGIIPKALQRLKWGIQEPVIVDLMASPYTLASLKAKQFPLRRVRFVAAGVDEARTPKRQAKDKRAGVRFVQGNLRNPATWNGIDTTLGGKKAHIVMERGYGAHRHIPQRVPFYEASVSRVWDMLNPRGGIAILQTPDTFTLNHRGIDIDAWTKEASDAGIYTRFGTIFQKDAVEYGYLLLRRDSEDQVLPWLGKHPERQTSKRAAKKEDAPLPRRQAALYALKQRLGL